MVCSTSIRQEASQPALRLPSQCPCRSAPSLPSRTSFPRCRQALSLPARLVPARVPAVVLDYCAFPGAVLEDEKRFLFVLVFLHR